MRKRKAKKKPKVGPISFDEIEQIQREAGEELLREQRLAKRRARYRTRKHK
jgi:hypothetical protein